MEQKPTCPDCKGTIVRALISTDTAYRFECANVDCLKNFMIPKEGFGPSPILTAGMQKDKEANMAAKLGACSKGCGRTKWSGAGPKAMHEKFCTGEAKATRTFKEPKPKKAKTAPRGTTKVQALKPGKTGFNFAADVVAMLEDKRTQRIAELTSGDPMLAEIDRLLSFFTSRPT